MFALVWNQKASLRAKKNMLLLLNEGAHWKLSNSIKTLKWQVSKSGWRGRKDSGKNLSEPSALMMATRWSLQLCLRIQEHQFTELFVSLEPPMSKNTTMPAVPADLWRLQPEEWLLQNWYEPFIYVEFWKEVSNGRWIRISQIEEWTLNWPLPLRSETNGSSSVKIYFF